MAANGSELNSTPHFGIYICFHFAYCEYSSQRAKGTYYTLILDSHYGGTGEVLYLIICIYNYVFWKFLRTGL